MKIPPTDRQALARREIKVASKIPYTHHYNSSTLFTKNGYMLKTLRIDGFYATCEGSESVNHKHDILYSLINNIASDSIAIYQHTIRREERRFPAGSFESGSFEENLNDIWKAELNNTTTLVNELYLTIVIKPYVGAQETLMSIAKLFSAFRGGTRKASIYNNKILHDKLDAVVSHICKSLNDYHPRLLEVVETSKGPISLPLSFLSYIVNGVYRLLAPPRMDIANYLPSARPYFGHRTFILEGSNYKRFGAILGVKEYCATTSPTMFNKLLSIPHELVITQSFSFLDRRKASNMMGEQMKLLTKSEDPSQSLVIELEDALDLLNRGSLAMGWHHLSISTFTINEADLHDAVSSVVSALPTIAMVREDLNMENAFWAQLPGNQRFVARSSAITSKNFASFASMHNFPVGQFNGNHWGNAITAFKTTSDTRYFFNFHVGDLGHATLIGPSGTGKTLLMAFLVAQTLKHKPRIIWFDKDRGAEIFIRAVHGAYQIIKPGKPSGMNPLQLSDTESNRDFLRDWLAILLTSNNEILSDEDRNYISKAITGNYDLDKSKRQLEHIAPFLGLRGSESLQQRLSPWYGKGQLAYLFDNAVDSLDFQNQINGFDLGALLNNSIARTPIIHYLFHRVEQVLDGQPTMIPMDEGWKYIQDKLFEEKIEDKLKTIRKKNGMILFATNDVDDAYRSRIRSTLVQQTATNIFFPNFKADAEQYRAFGLTDHEIELIKRMNVNDRCFLIKQGKHSVVVKFDLAQYHDLVRILSTTESNVRELDTIRESVGDDPSEWLSKLEKKGAIK